MSRWHTLLRLNARRARVGLRPTVGFGPVLRIPGTAESEGPANPKDVVSTRSTDRRYNLSDFAEYLDDAAIPDPQAQEKAAREWAERFADKPLVINTDARIPQEMLDGWMAADMRFKNTWLRQRHDLKDQSQSGYDLALAAFGDRGRSDRAADRGPDHSPPEPVRKKPADAPGLLPADHRHGVPAQSRRPDAPAALPGASTLPAPRPVTAAPPGAPGAPGAGGCDE